MAVSQSNFFFCPSLFSSFPETLIPGALPNNLPASLAPSWNQLPGKHSLQQEVVSSEWSGSEYTLKVELNGFADGLM